MQFEEDTTFRNFTLIIRYTVLHQLDQKIIYPHHDFKHLTEQYFEIGMKLNDFMELLKKVVSNSRWSGYSKQYYLRLNAKKHVT